MGIKITLDQFPSIIEKELKNVRLAALRAVHNTGQLGTGLAIRETSRKKKPDGGIGAVDRGLFKNSWFPLFFKDRAEIRNDAPYAGTIENGSRPHWVPLKVLLEWVYRKRGELGIKGQAIGTKGRRRSLRTKTKSGVKYSSEVYMVAKAIQRKIAKKGTKPMFIMKDLIPDLEKTLNREFKKFLNSLAKG